MKVAWHKARALSALQTYFNQPLKEPLPAQTDARLKDLSRETIARGGTSIDTALFYYTEVAQVAALEGRDLNEMRFGGVLGSMFALQEEMRFYREHLEALKRIQG